MVSCPSIDWVSYFQAFDEQRQDEFELALVTRGISLGEYMEIIEHAAMDACAQAILKGYESFEAQDVLPNASLLLSRYVKQKRILAAREPRSVEGASVAKPAHQRLELRAAIHRLIENIKSGLHLP